MCIVLHCTVLNSTPSILSPLASFIILLSLNNSHSPGLVSLFRYTSLLSFKLSSVFSYVFFTTCCLSCSFSPSMCCMSRVFLLPTINTSFPLSYLHPLPQLSPYPHLYFYSICNPHPFPLPLCLPSPLPLPLPVSLLLLSQSLFFHLHLPTLTPYPPTLTPYSPSPSHRI